MDRSTSRSDRVADAVYASVALVAAAAAAATQRDDPVVLVLLVVALLPWAIELAGRTPPAWLIGVLGLVPVAVVIARSDVGVAMFVATAALSRLASRTRSSWSVVLLAVIGALLPFIVLGTGWPFDPGDVYFAFGNVFGVAVGLLVRRARTLGERLRRADARLASAAADEERARLARDVHDLVAHSLTIVVLQIGGARRVLRAEPAVAEEALLQAEQVCRESLDGIRGVVGLLRTADGSESTALDIDALAATYRSAGVSVALTVAGDPAALPLLARGTTYRVVQEALANAARYRRDGTPVSVEITAGDAGATVRVTNRRGEAGRRAGAAGGHGLPGLREQVAALGGALSSGPADDDAWVVEAVVPRSAPLTATAVGRS